MHLRGASLKTKTVSRCFIRVIVFYIGYEIYINDILEILIAFSR